jgi:PHIKZ203
MVSSFFNTLIGRLSIQETPEFVRISGIPPWQIESAIHSIWNSSRVSENLVKLSRNEFAVHKFLLPDFLYVLQELLKQKYLKVSRRTIQELIDKLKTETWLSRLDKDYDRIVDLSQLSKFHKKPLPHQAAYLEVYNDKVPRYGLRGHLLSAVPGAGKTMNSLYLMECLGMDTIIIISPKNALEDVWAKTLHNEFKVTPNFWVSSRMKPLELGYRYYVAHFEQIDRFVEFFKDKGKHLGRVGVITDEVHAFNDIKSKRTQNLIHLVRDVLNAEHTVLMSGTPIKAMALETVPMMKMLDPLFTPKAEDIYLKIFGKSTIRALDILSHRLGYMSFRVEKKEVMSVEIDRYTIQVPLKNGGDYTLDTIRSKMRKFVEERIKYYKDNERKYIDDYQLGLAYYEDWLSVHGTPVEKSDFVTYKKYIQTIRSGYDAKLMKTESLFCNKFENDNIAPRIPQGRHRQAFRKAKSVYKYVNLTILGEALGSVLGKIRVQCNVDVALAIENVVREKNTTKEKVVVSTTDLINNASKKTIFFTSYVEVVKALQEKCIALGFKPLVVYGDTNKDLVNIVKEFDQDKDANPLIATFQSLSTAVPLVMANNVIMLNNPFRPHEYQQAEARAARIGQDSVVDVTDVFLDTKGVPNISTRSKDILDWAAENVAAMLGVKVDIEKTVTESIDGKEEVIEYTDMDNVLDIIAIEGLECDITTTVESTTVDVQKKNKSYLGW